MFLKVKLPQQDGLQGHCSIQSVDNTGGSSSEGVSEKANARLQHRVATGAVGSATVQLYHM